MHLTLYHRTQSGCKLNSKGMNLFSVLKTRMNQCLGLERNMKSHLVLSSAHKPGTSGHPVSACIPLVMEDSLPYKTSWLLVSRWLIILGFGCGSRSPLIGWTTSSPILLPPCPSGSQEPELELMLAVTVLPVGFPPRHPLEHTATEGPGAA